jgi:hypothetical protein
MRTLFGIAIIAVAVVITTWSEPTVGKTPTVSVDPAGLMATATNVPQAHYKDFSTILLMSNSSGYLTPWSLFSLVTGALFYTRCH